MPRKYVVTDPQRISAQRRKAVQARWARLDADQRREALRPARQAAVARAARVRALLAEIDGGSAA